MLRLTLLHRNNTFKRALRLHRIQFGEVLPRHHEALVVLELELVENGTAVRHPVDDVVRRVFHVMTQDGHND